MRSRSQFATIAVAIAGIFALAACGSDQAANDRQATVASIGAQVMPFDLTKTTHTFKKTADGGHQLVTANDPADTEQTTLIRQHLRDEQANFTKGNYDDPARIHGMNMPGVSELAAGYHHITVTYQHQPAGGELDYRSDDPALVTALHAWFDRQVMDHGDHARPG